MPDSDVYNYFVSYSYGDGRSQGFGSTHVMRLMPVTSYADVLDLTESVIENQSRGGIQLRPEGVVIVNFILLSGPKEA